MPSRCRPGMAAALGSIWLRRGTSRQEALDAFMHKTPVEPENLRATGIDETELLSLFIKQIYSWRLESNREFG